MAECELFKASPWCWAGFDGQRAAPGARSCRSRWIPNNSSNVYVAWADGTTANVHVRHSTTGGTTWDSSDLKSIITGDNPALAINKAGILGFLYQKYVSSGTCHTGGGAAACWETHFETYDGTSWTDLPTRSPTPRIMPAVFRSVTTSTLWQWAEISMERSPPNNYPDTNNFYSGVQYQRYVDLVLHQFYADRHTRLPDTPPWIHSFFTSRNCSPIRTSMFATGPTSHVQP